MRLLTDSAQSLTNHLSHSWSRVGMASFTFFMLKGLLWLLAPVLFGFMR
jgi:hypothetical protein